MNYSTEGLKKIFPKYFPDNLAEQYARNPEKVGSRVYANRMGNGDEASKEGYKFRGRGYIQLTGKDNYKSFGSYLKEDLVTNPDLLIIPKNAILSTAWFWTEHKLNQIADRGNTDEVIKLVTTSLEGMPSEYDAAFEEAADKS